MGSPQSNVTVLATIPQNTALAHHEYVYTEEQIQLVKNTVAPGLTNDQFALFMYVAKVKNLDPLQRQVHAVTRRVWNRDLNDGRGGYEQRMTIQTGIDGYRAIANRTGLYMPSEKEARIEGNGTPDLRVTFFVKKWSELDKQYHEYSATAYYREFVQTRKEKEGNKETVVPVEMWKKMPLNQLTKCAEALALRKGWPEELGMIRTDEEMQSAENIAMSQHEKDSEKDTAAQHREKARGTLSPSAEQNRGHGGEGAQRGKIIEPEKKTTEVVATDATPAIVDDSKKKETMRGWVFVKSVEYKTRKADAKKKEAEKKYVLLVVSAKDGDGVVKDFDVYAWHETLITNARHLVDKTCDVELATTVSKDKKKQFYSLEVVHSAGDLKFVDNEPMSEFHEEPKSTEKPQGMPLEFK